jgi:nitroimidazol reductase NimA-like FMN-containing flavoprotein (pyridoxamine 5'-phosphate oxidase superfamily)
VLIEELTSRASLDFLAHIHVGRLGCSHAGQPYVVPIYFSYQDDFLYTFSTIGRKIEWMRANPLVCIQADEVVSAEHWVSVVVFGEFEELPDTPDFVRERALAHDLLQKKAMWWEPGFAKTVLHGFERPLVPIFYRIQIKQITGHRAIP